jgi:cytochrome b subunit of formate dehydrogenase
VKGFIGHLGWVFGINQLPRYDRWSWWEKFDYWAVWWGLMIVGITGLMLYDPVLTSDYMPGWTLNVALWVHRIEAVLAMGYTFIIHFTIEHWRPSAFPFNAAMFDGTMDLEEAKHEHPEWVARLDREGRLGEALAIPPPVPLRILYFLFGYSIIILGVFLLVFAIANAALLTLF